MSGHPRDHYDDGYGHQQQATDSYYQDEHNQGYYDLQEYPQHGAQPQDYGHHPQGNGNGGYYDESLVPTFHVGGYLTHE